jgi:hypothetical protein
MRRHEFIAGLGGLHSLVASALLSVLLLAAPLGAGLPSRLVGKASAGEPAEPLIHNAGERRGRGRCSGYRLGSRGLG